MALKAKDLTICIHHKERRSESLTKQRFHGIRTSSKVRVLVEYIFGVQNNDIGGTFVRSIGG